MLACVRTPSDRKAEIFLNLDRDLPLTRSPCQCRPFNLRMTLPHSAASRGPVLRYARDGNTRKY